MTDQTMTHEQALEWLKGLRNATGDQVCAEIEAGKAAEAAQAFRAALSRPADTKASRTLDALIALASGDDGLPDDLRADVERLRARLGSPAVPEGWKLVPVEPTIDMIGAASRKMKEIPQHHFHEYRAGIAPDIWNWMLAAAPAEESLGDTSEPVYRLTIRDDRSDVIDACPALLDLDPGHYELHARPESAEGDSE